jgi:hypothetical protein
MPAPAASPLSDKAVKDAMAHIKTLLTGDLALERLDADQAWHDMDLREVFEQRMRLWYSYGDFDVFLDDKNVAVGFFDKTKVSGSVYRNLPHPEIIKLAVATGFVAPNARVLSVAKAPADTLQAVLAVNPTDAASPRIVVRINTKLNRVISLVPEGVIP